MWNILDENQDGILYQCAECQLKVRTKFEPEKIYHKCKSVVEEVKQEETPQNMPNIFTRLRNFGKALVEHVKNGMPVCNNEQIQERLKLCQSCGHFKATNTDMTEGVCAHGKCGCNLNGNMELMNKISWLDQNCPINRWPRLYNLDSDTEHK